MGTEEYYSEVEVEHQLAKLSQADIARLIQIFTVKGCEARAGMAGGDVLNQAVTRVLGGHRLWRKDHSAVQFLIGAGSSIIDNEAKRRAREQLTSSIDEFVEETDLNEVSAEVAERLSNKSVQCEVEAEQDDAGVNQWLNKIRRLFSGDTDVLCYLEQKLSGIKKAEILHFCQFTDTTYRAVERRFKDKIRKRFPLGFGSRESQS